MSNLQVCSQRMRFFGGGGLRTPPELLHHTGKAAVVHLSSKLARALALRPAPAAHFHLSRPTMAFLPPSRCTASASFLLLMLAFSGANGLSVVGRVRLKLGFGKSLREEAVSRYFQGGMCSFVCHACAYELVHIKLLPIELYPLTS